MGCSSSSDKPAASAPAPAPAPAPARPAAKKGAKRKPPAWVGKHFQVKLGGDWKDYDKDEDVLITRAFLVGQPNCRFKLRGSRYEYNFKKMSQINLDTGKEREIRPPPGMKPPKDALLPAGPMIVINVQKGQPGTCIHVDDPKNPGQKIQVAVPKNAKVGSKLAVPLPGEGETVQEVMKKQEGMSAGGKVALAGAGLIGVGAVAVGGIVLGDYLTGGDMGTEEMAADAGDAIVDAAEDVGEWAEGAGETIADAAEEFADGAGADIVDWLADAGDTIGDVVMDLF
mmetsp:Transcript_53279/g.127094  ORF Transcript_53279/g.127094 Transcript_53279/m.127094 type:complete len:284 (+) Transcript_53279:65-916(+)|eukprot:CAMPEP_0178410692 /NCGR_PEP_ID=MMETSP0689_2-20121128/21113_1 /TAXON_ID=160604 /ORGANISM="Amphidinium massartii, Strain CS-259" /LENGTH=283 /DNA_ID=CAMNT_0020031881 /DNA_START=63 /DNA_END=914 /DNA_ORIENTATION=+